MSGRLVPVISLRDYENRKDEIRKQLVEAAEYTGFLTLVDHALSEEEIETQFAINKKFFDLSSETKHKTKHDPASGLGYENKGQFRPLTGFDQKESLFVRPTSQWPSEEDVPGFAESTKNFLAKCALISDQVLSCFGEELGFPEGYFKEAMDVSQPDCVSQLRLLHYPAVQNSEGGWRHGSHTDIGCLSLVFQRTGEDGLEVLPGRETHTSKIGTGEFFPVPAKTGPIVVNIGDMLMVWSDDRFKANFHRVRAKDNGFSPDRYSMGYFNMGRENFVFQGPSKKYPAITCGNYFYNHIKKQFAQYNGNEEKVKNMQESKSMLMATA